MKNETIEENKEVWCKVLERVEDLPEGRVVSVIAQHRGLCLTHHDGKFAAQQTICMMRWKRFWK